MIDVVAKRKKKKSKKNKKLDEGGMAREWPGPHGPMISPNYDLGSGPYSQNNGLPFGGIPAKDFIEKHRKLRYKAKGKLMAQLEYLTDELYKVVG